MHQCTYVIAAGLGCAPPSHTATIKTPQYKDSQEAFFQDYAASHAKLSELGAEWEVAGGVAI